VYAPSNVAPAKAFNQHFTVAVVSFDVSEMAAEEMRSAVGVMWHLFSRYTGSGNEIGKMIVLVLF